MTTPSDTRIAQWIDAASTSGLLHLAFQLADEPEEVSHRWLRNHHIGVAGETGGLVVMDCLWYLFFVTQGVKYNLVTLLKAIFGLLFR